MKINTDGTADGKYKTMLTTGTSSVIVFIYTEFSLSHIILQ